MNENTTRLYAYGDQLVQAGFEVWHTPMTSRSGGYLQYRDPATGAHGSLQFTEWDGWQHLMPIVPSRENGSSMHLDTTTDPFTVEAARECARPSNRNSVVGTQRNAMASTWRSPDAVALHAPTLTPQTSQAPARTSRTRSR